jgi:hypothetical protein
MINALLLEGFLTHSQQHLKIKSSLGYPDSEKTDISFPG